MLLTNRRSVYTAVNISTVDFINIVNELKNSPNLKQAFQAIKLVA